MLAGWRFMITTRGTANIVAARAGRVHGVLWHISPQDLVRLDGWEGTRRRNYLRRRFLVRARHGADWFAFAYVSQRHYSGVARVDYLESAVLPGAHAFGLPADAIAELRGWLPGRSIGAARVYRGRRR